MVDNWPVRVYIGEVEHEALLPGKEIQRSGVYLYPHLNFVIGVNQDQIVAVNVNTDLCRRVEITNDPYGMDVEFSYSVEWISTPETTSKNRVQLYPDDGLLVINWLVIILSSLALVSLILMKTFPRIKSFFDEVGEIASSVNLFYAV
jgi:hypothetical protein